MARFLVDNLLAQIGTVSICTRCSYADGRGEPLQGLTCKENVVAMMAVVGCMIVEQRGQCHSIGCLTKPGLLSLHSSHDVSTATSSADGCLRSCWVPGGGLLSETWPVKALLVM